MVEDGRDGGPAEQHDEGDEGIRPIPVMISDRKAKQNTKENKQNRNNIKTIKRSNKAIQALSLPTVMNVNPRSIYNKANEFQNFVKEELVDVVTMSESWERVEDPLENIIQLPNHTVISNPHQRKGMGGRPALIINHKKYNIKNLTQSFIEIPCFIYFYFIYFVQRFITNCEESNLRFHS